MLEKFQEVFKLRDYLVKIFQMPQVLLLSLPHKIFLIILVTNKTAVYLHLLFVLLRKES
jgi:hypothetical protein